MLSLFYKPASINDAFRLMRGVNMSLCLRTVNYSTFPMRWSFHAIYVILFLTLNFVLVYDLTCETLKEKKKYALYDYVQIASPLYCLFLVSICIYDGYFNTAKYDDYIVKLKHIDDTLANLYVPVTDYNSVIIKTIVVVVFYIINLFFNLHNLSPLNNSQIRSFFVWSLCLSTGYIRIHDLVINIQCVSHRFKCLNDYLEKYQIRTARDGRMNLIKIVNGCLKRINVNSCRSEAIQPILIAKQVHLELQKCVKILCQIFNSSLSVQLSVTMFIIVFNLHGSVALLTSQSIIPEKLRLLITVMITSVTTNILLIVHICYTCQTFVSEVKRIKEIVHSFKLSSPRIRDELKVFSLQIWVMPDGISFPGYGTLGYTLLVKIIGTAAKFIVIVAQVTNWQE